MLSKLKTMLEIPAENTDRDEKLQLIIESVQSRLKVLLGEDTVPEKLEFIIFEVSIVRFNRIGSEGMSINNVDGETQHYNTNDFLPYNAEIQAYLESKQSTAQKGGFKFL